MDKRESEGDLKCMEETNEHESDQESPQNGSDRFQDVDFSHGRSILSHELRIDLGAVSEKGSMRETDGEENEKGAIKDWSETQTLSRRDQKNILEDSREIESEREGGGKDEMNRNKNLESLLDFVGRLADQERTDGFQDKPVGKNHPQGQFIAEKGDKQFPQ